MYNETEITQVRYTIWDKLKTIINYEETLRQHEFLKSKIFPPNDLDEIWPL